MPSQPRLYENGPSPSEKAGRARRLAQSHGAGRDWATAPEVFAPLHAEFNFTLDPCATPANAKCPLFYTEADNGLTKDWSGHRVFMNPPYGREIPAWTRKARDSGAFVVGLLPASTDLAWWHEDVLGHTEIRFLRRRTRFIDKDGRSRHPFAPSVIVIWRPSR